MTDSQDKPVCCTLCPAMCHLDLIWSGPDLARIEYATTAGRGICPRGSALGELMYCPKRFRWPRRSEQGKLVDLSLSDGIAAAAKLMAGGATVLADGNLPVEELAELAEIAAAWKGVSLAPVVMPEDEQLLLGLEASGAHYLADEELARCDGFVLIGSPFAANPMCARGIFAALKERPRSPVVVLDSGAGVAGSFATFRVACPAGGELTALSGGQIGKAVSACQKLGVIISAEAGRGAIWSRVGLLAGQLANAQRGGVSVQTVGANALAAVRIARQLKLLSFAKAMTPGAGVRVALGVDVLGMLGWAGPAFPIAAAALPNATSDSAQVILPLALPCELGGTFLQAGTRHVEVGPLMAPPKGVPTPAQLMRMLAQAAGVKLPAFSGHVPSLERLALPVPQARPIESPTGPALVAARLAAIHGDGALTAHASWQRQLLPVPDLKMNPDDAARLELEDLTSGEVETASGKAAVRIRINPNLAQGTLSISEGFAAARRLMPYVIDADADALVSPPSAVRSIKRSR